MSVVATIDFDVIRARHPLPEYCESRGIRLRRAGSILQGKCPIHNEVHGQSFVVYPKGERWHCFGKCQRGGDVLDLERELAGGTVKDATERLRGSAAPIPAPFKPRRNPGPEYFGPNQLPYRMSDDEIRSCHNAALRLLTNERAIKLIAHRREWQAETIRKLALEPALGRTDDGKLAFLYESGLKVRWKENGERRFGWRFGKNWFWRGGYIKQAKTFGSVKAKPTQSRWLIAALKTTAKRLSSRYQAPHLRLMLGAFSLPESESCFARTTMKRAANAASIWCARSRAWLVKSLTWIGREFNET
jgi:CHC2 zinc finger